jgi:cobalamin synthase
VGGFGLVSALAVAGGRAEGYGCARALGVCILAVLIGWAFSLGPRRRLGGISGDLIGYSAEICEVAALTGLLLLKLA